MREAIWHIIFECERGGKIMDFCREEPEMIVDMETEEMIRFPTEEESRAWADAQMKRYQAEHGLSGYRMEKW